MHFVCPRCVCVCVWLQITKQMTTYKLVQTRCYKREEFVSSINAGRNVHGVHIPFYPGSMETWIERLPTLSIPRCVPLSRLDGDAKRTVPSSQDTWACRTRPWRWDEVVYYESLKRELKTKPIYEFRCDERLQTKSEEFTRLTCTLK